MADEPIRDLDATDVTQVIVALQEWINSLGILSDYLYMEYTEGPAGFGFCIKSDGGAVMEEDIAGGFTAEVPFMIYHTTNAVPDGAGMIYKPLNDLSTWFRANGPAGLQLGVRRIPYELTTLRGPTDMAGKDEDGNTTFFSIFQLTYDEEAI